MVRSRRDGFIAGAVRPSRRGEPGVSELGHGPATIVAIPPLAQNIELTWERPEYRTMLERLGSFARVLHFDTRVDVRPRELLGRRPVVES